MQPHLRLAFLMPLMLSMTSDCRAVINIMPSLEWKTTSCDLLILGRIDSCDAETTRAEIRVDRVLKGELSGSGVRVDWKPELRRFVGSPWCLFFLRSAVGPEGQRTGEYRLDSEPAHFCPIQAGELISETFAVIKDTADALAIISAHADEHVTRYPRLRDPHPSDLDPWETERGPVGAIRKEVPPDSEAFRYMYSLSACYLDVPARADDRERALEQARSENKWEQVWAAIVLGNFKDDETIEVLRGLLTSTATKELGRRHGSTHTIYPLHFVRQAAYSSLLQLGVEVEKPTIVDSSGIRVYPVE